MKFRKDLKNNPSIKLKFCLSAPFLYSLVVPFVLLDVTMEIYHRFCFPLVGIPYVKRGDYIRFDRQKLSYLWWWEKINCAYCGYANGLLAYGVAIAGETEKYWCGIMHAKYQNFHEPKHHKDFLPYDDKEAFETYVNQK